MGFFDRFRKQAADPAPAPSVKVGRSAQKLAALQEATSPAIEPQLTWAQRLANADGDAASRTVGRSLGNDQSIETPGAPTPTPSVKAPSVSRKGLKP